MRLREKKERMRAPARAWQSLRGLLGRLFGRPGLRVYLFNVGQGDHLLLEFPNGEFGVVDFYYEETLGMMEPPGLTYLKHLQRSEPGRDIVISFVCLSHPDYDHVKGVDSFLGWVGDSGVRVKHFWLFAGRNFEDLYQQYLEAVAKYAETDQERDDAVEFKRRLEGIRNFLESKRGREGADYLQGIRLLSDSVGDCAEVNLLAPLTRHVVKFERQSLMDLFKLLIKGRKHVTAQTNLLSSVLFVKFRKHGLLFGGDTGIEVWDECLTEFRERGHERKLGKCEANFVKVSHHGSRNSSSPGLWAQILKRRADCYFGISAGRRYGHPHAETLRDISAAAGSLRSRATILSTNACTACVVSQKLPEVSFDWLRYPDPGYTRDMKDSIKHMAPPASAVEKGVPVLSAYVFDFDARRRKVGLTKGLSPLMSEHFRCVYNNGHSKHFPDCARPAH
jgi:beta-lactamase superfamily II metal-dependent hydrolase